MTAKGRVCGKNHRSFCVQFPFTLSMPFKFRLFSYFSFMSDIELIDTCRKLIEEKFHLPGNGSWKQRDFPPPVGKRANVSLPDNTDRMTSSCKGRKAS